MSVHLESLTEDNFVDTIQHDEASGLPGFLPIPYDGASADALLGRAILAREQHTGDILAAYDDRRGHLFVGCGEFSHQDGELSFANWVVSALRRNRYGYMLRTALEARALETFPGAHTMTAHVHHLNRPAQAFAGLLGYEETGEVLYGQLIVYRKPARTAASA